MKNLIPPVGTRGRYTVRQPFSVKDDVIYECTALRRFSDIEAQGLRVYEMFYQPFGLSETDVGNDRRLNAYVATLESDSYAPLYVPTTYITSYPDGAYRSYHRVVLSAELGPIPDYIDLSFAITQMQDVLSDVIGIEPKVAVSVAPMTDRVTPEQHEALEVARTGAIKTRTTDYAKYLSEKQKNQRLESRIALLETVLRDSGQLP